MPMRWSGSRCRRSQSASRGLICKVSGKKQLLAERVVGFQAAAQFLEQDALVRGVLIDQHEAVLVFHEDVQPAEHAEEVELAGAVSSRARRSPRFGVRPRWDRTQPDRPGAPARQRRANNPSGGSFLVIATGGGTRSAGRSPAACRRPSVRNSAGSAAAAAPPAAAAGETSASSPPGRLPASGARRPTSASRTAPGSRKRTSRLAGWTFTSTAAGSMSINRYATGYRPFISAVW